MGIKTYEATLKKTLLRLTFSSIFSTSIRATQILNSLFVGLVLYRCPGSYADMAILGASKDNTLFESEDGLLSNGDGDYLFAGKTAFFSELRRGLIAFDIAEGIPTGSTIDSVTLTLHMSKTNVGSQDVSLHRVLQDWGEGDSDADGEEGIGAESTIGDATWIHTFYSNVFWTVTGGDFNTTPSATSPISNEGFYAWSSSSMMADVQQWLNNPDENFGWLILADETVTGAAKRFDSRTNPNPDARPILVIEFTAPFTVGACCLSGGSCTMTSSTDCDLRAGTYQGDGTPCTPSTCPEPIGACCLNDGTCEERSATDCETQNGSYQGDQTGCVADACTVMLTPFVDELPIPPVIQPINGVAGGEAEYEIPMQEFEQQLHRDLPNTRLWGYDGIYPGPTIEATRGQQVSVNWINDLRDSNGNLRTNHFLPVDQCLHGPNMAGPVARTVVHLHGAHVDPESDGFPEDAYPPGFSATYTYPNNQLPTTLWYHDHGMGITRLNVYMGLAGFYLIRDAFEQSLGLPSGEFEIPLVIQDRSFNVDGSLQYPAAWKEHFFGDKILVNGKVWPFLNVKRGKYRFRLLNGSNSRFYRLSGVPIQQIGSDGGLLSAPVPQNEVILAPGERADVVVDFAPYAAGTELILTNSAPVLFPGTPGTGVITNVMKFIVTNSLGDTSPLPETLRPIEPLAVEDVANTRDFVIRREPNSAPSCADPWFLINGLRWVDVTEFPVRGSTEIWRFINRTGQTHPMHMHLLMFQVLDRQPFDVIENEIVPIGEPTVPGPEEAGWKDTVRANPFEITRVIARFETFTGTYVYHCHMLEHEDHELMRQFVVIPEPEITDISITNSNVQVSFTTVSNIVYRLDRNDIISSNEWTAVTNSVVGTGGIMTITDPDAANLPNRFYEVGIIQ